MVLRLFKKIFIAFVPIIIAVILFFLFETYDYFGVKGTSLYSSKPLSTMRELILTDNNNIILGASQMANLNVDYIEELTGDRYTMLAFGGANMDETVESFWYAADRVELEKVVIGMNFYTMDDSKVGGRMDDVIKSSEIVLYFMSHFNYWLEAINGAKVAALDAYANITGDQSVREIADDPSSFSQPDPVFPTDTKDGYRSDLADYSVLIDENTLNYGGVENNLASLLEIAEYCDNNNIQLTFVFSPVHKSVYENVVIPKGFEQHIERYKTALKGTATIYDFEVINEFTSNDDNFIDGFHVVLENKKLMARIIFAGEQTDICEIYPQS